MSKMSYDDLIERLKDLYSDYRTAMMNRKYYGHQLTRIKRCNLLFEIMIALGTASSGISALTIWKYGIGEKIWVTVTVTAIILAFLKPFLKLSDLIQRYSTLFIGHGDVTYDLKAIISKVKTYKVFNKELDNAYSATLERFKQLAAIDDPNPNKKLVRKYFNEVIEEVPPNTLWVPKKGEH